jgi:AcrR family transcriptional regulator
MATQRRTPKVALTAPAAGAIVPPPVTPDRKPDANGKGDGDSRRAAMCRAAAQSFRTRGFDATSVSDIARALGLTTAGLYHYFESKEALLFEIRTFGLECVRDEVVGRFAASAIPKNGCGS